MSNCHDGDRRLKPAEIALQTPVPMMLRSSVLRFVASFAALGLLSGCGAMDTVQHLIPHHDVKDEGINLGASPMQTAGVPAKRPSEKPKVLAIASTDINCPTIDVPDGGAALRVGGPDNASVRYQFNIGDTARQCDPAGPGQASIKIGVKGDVVLGQAGSAGTFSAPVHIEIVNNADKKPVFSKTFTVQASTDADHTSRFQLVTDPIVVPMPTLQLADLYTISVGFGPGGEKPERPRKRRHKT